MTLLKFSVSSEASQASIELLKEQHQQWQRAVEDLLAQVQAAAESEDVRPVTMPQHILYKREASEEVPSMSSQMPHSLAVQKQPSHGLASTATPLNTISRSPGFHVQENSPLKKLVNEVLEAHRTEDPEEPKGLWASLRERSRRIVEAQWFEYVTGAVILLNMITIYVEVDASIQTGESPWPPWVELSFWFLYTVELIFRLLAHGLTNFCNAWFILDAFLVIVGFIALVIIPIVGDDANIGGFEFEKLLVVRGLRLLRLVRALRMMRQFKVMWRLVYSLLTAGQTMLSMTALILLALFIFGCVAVELIRKDQELLDDPETGPVVRKYFNTLPTSILTLLQFVTLDSVAAIYYPLLVVRPLLIIFFAPILVIVSVGLMNLVTAILVESALESAQQEAEAGRQELKNKIKGALPSLLDIFQTLDTDMSGFITRDELDAVPVDILPASVLERFKDIGYKFIHQAFRMASPAISAGYVVNPQEPDRPRTKIEQLDVDGTGTLTLQEFVEGLMNLALLDVPIWTIQSQRMLRSVRTLATKIDQDIQSMKAPGLIKMPLPQSPSL
ncbi:Voltage-dependent T-type calcium channel subunit alpha-1H [Symbiodinium microadriaticum]|uniref:Voltage-dependent T-type calcium channel subunit alpha-1H n=1 Tax=Symbiodinium microadriaticum TaxID=2951 RepID=A0A1Q9DGW9_SYMMI|nr:Voltage-dependent T-type calcium channel subunit alpha-1H [Symbiodinium microadriaticum]